MVVNAAAGSTLIYRVDIPAQEHVGFALEFSPSNADVVLYLDRYDGVDAALLGLTDAGPGVRTLAAYEPNDGAHVLGARRGRRAAHWHSQRITRTGFVDGPTCIEDCERLMQLPLPIDVATDGYDWTASTVMRYQFGRRDLIMLTRFAAAEMAKLGYGPIIPEDFSQWDGETPGVDRGAPRHASHQRGKDVDISLYGDDGLKRRGGATARSTTTAVVIASTAPWSDTVRTRTR